MKKSIKTIMQERGLDLNPQQLAAVKDLKGVSIVNAGAGTGKSSVIVAKTLYAQLLNEENRLAYVAATRAMEELFISYPNIAKNGKVNEPSRYFVEFYNVN